VQGILSGQEKERWSVLRNRLKYMICIIYTVILIPN
jgi:hypothetical protein